MIGYVTGRSDVGFELSRPPEWESAHRRTAKPPVVSNIDLGGEQSSAIRFGVRATHTVRSVVHSVLGLLFAVLAVGSVVLTVGDPTVNAVAGSMVLMVFAGLFLSAGVVGIVSARRGLGVDLSREAIVVGLGGGRTVIDWTDVAGVSAATESGHDVIVVSARNHEDLIGSTVPCSKLKADPVVVFHTLQFYASHRSKRAELGTDAALRRIKTRQLT